jgi:F420-dependent oxidoreductase-like protein
MQIGIQAGTTPGPVGGSLEDLVAQARLLEARGFASLSLAHIFGLDAIGALTVIGRETERIELTTGVVPVYSHHPIAMAQRALTAGVACGGRFTLGLGLSHKIVIENMLGLSFERPARHMREYLEIMGPLLRGEPVQFEGEQLSAAGELQVPGASRVPVLVAALGPVMLALAGRLAEGTITWMAGLRTLESYVIPEIGSAAKRAGRPEPRVVAHYPIAVVADADAARERIGGQLRMYGTLPSYRALLDREGAAGPGEVALVGDESEVRDQLRRLAEIGLSDFQAVVVDAEDGAGERTLAFLASQIEEV